MRNQIVERIAASRIIVIVRGLAGEKIVALAEALCEGGIELMEVTFDQSRPESRQDTVDVIRALAANMGDRMSVGAGTVTSVELVETAHRAGAKYIVSPDFRPEVVFRTRELDMVSLPGALTPTEIGRAYDQGADFVKVFPAAELGPGYIRAIRAPLNHIPLLAVGGVDERNARDFIEAGCAGIGVGGNLVNRAWIQAGEWGKITGLARRFVEAVRQGGAAR
ncbi:MAG: bifunctional 4-hydroxy-2-oxoglutarate aldolase/2-dehydro-3-deoxy-phosphogluconate aldolase [Clostridiales bacterium]|nr:bifunctional 4-hydroxy-2-oxoglutarate aldolase/2-dehydro-3-deoxy-phosphogluconate aldolase [Clostridiales bacterium]